MAQANPSLDLLVYVHVPLLDQNPSDVTDAGYTQARVGADQLGSHNSHKGRTLNPR